MLKEDADDPNAVLLSRPLINKLKNFYIEINPRDYIDNPFKMKLLKIRRFLHNNQFIFLLVKFLVGLVFCFIPIFLFCLIIKNALDNKNYDLFTKATWPLLISITITMGYIIILLVYRLYSLCSSKK